MAMFWVSPRELASPILRRASPRMSCHFLGFSAPTPSSFSAMSSGYRTIDAAVPSLSACCAALT